MHIECCYNNRLKRKCLWIITASIYIRIFIFCDHEIWAQLIHRMMSYFCCTHWISLKSIKSICSHSFRLIQMGHSPARIWWVHAHHQSIEKKRRRAKKIDEHKNRYQVSLLVIRSLKKMRWMEMGQFDSVYNKCSYQKQFIIIQFNGEANICRFARMEIQKLR